MCILVRRRPVPTYAAFVPFILCFIRASALPHSSVIWYLLLEPRPILPITPSVLDGGGGSTYCTCLLLSPSPHPGEWSLLARFWSRSPPHAAKNLARRLGDSRRCIHLSPSPPLLMSQTNTKSEPIPACALLNVTFAEYTALTLDGDCCQDEDERRERVALEAKEIKARDGDDDDDGSMEGPYGGEGGLEQQ